jgi:hypothetical protein
MNTLATFKNKNSNKWNNSNCKINIYNKFNKSKIEKIAWRRQQHARRKYTMNIVFGDINILNTE